MNVLALQFDIVWENKPANLDKVRRLLAATAPAPGTLVVLPEMFATGFTPNLALAEDTGESVAAIAREYRVKLLAGLVRRPQNPTRPGHNNEAVLFDETGTEQGRYAKVHPFRIAGEPALPGAGPVVWSCAGVRLAPAVCYDLRFPELFRAVEAELFCVIANWPTPRLHHWVTLLQARAIENQAYVLGVNRCGRDPGNVYPGRSQLISPRGEVLADAGAEEGMLAGTLDLPALHAYRREFPVLADR